LSITSVNSLNTFLFFLSCIWLTTKLFINFKDLIIKKLLFTALAVVAFSGVAMAEDSSEKEAFLFSRDCFAEGADYINNEYDPNNTRSNEDNEEAYTAYYTQCQKEEGQYIAAS
jgi:hypothetical protein